MSLKRLLFLLGWVFVTGCSTVELMEYGVFVDPNPINPNKAELIFRKGHFCDECLERSSVIQIGEKEFSVTFVRANYFLNPGEYELKMNYLYIGKEKSAGVYGAVSVLLEAGHRYYTEHFRDGDFVEVWLIDALTGEVPGSRFKKELHWVNCL